MFTGQKLELDWGQKKIQRKKSRKILWIEMKIFFNFFAIINHTLLHFWTKNSQLAIVYNIEHTLVRYYAVP